jgi:hypothetical protein
MEESLIKLMTAGFKQVAIGLGCNTFEQFKVFLPKAIRNLDKKGIVTYPHFPNMVVMRDMLSMIYTHIQSYGDIISHVWDAPLLEVGFEESVKDFMPTLSLLEDNLIQEILKEQIN